MVPLRTLATLSGALQCGGRGDAGIVIDDFIVIGLYSARGVSSILRNHVFADPEFLIRDQGVSHKGIRVGNDCCIGAGVHVLDGVALDAGRILAAAAVVTKSVPPASVVVGVPGQVVGSRAWPAAPSPPEGAGNRRPAAPSITRREG